MNDLYLPQLVVIDKIKVEVSGERPVKTFKFLPMGIIAFWMTAKFSM